MRSGVVHIFRLSVKWSVNFPGSLRSKNMEDLNSEWNAALTEQHWLCTAGQNSSWWLWGDKYEIFLLHFFTQNAAQNIVCVLCCVFSAMFVIPTVHNIQSAVVFCTVRCILSYALCINHTLGFKVTHLLAVIFIYIVLLWTVETSAFSSMWYNLMALSLWCSVLLC